MRNISGKKRGRVLRLPFSFFSGVKKFKIKKPRSAIVDPERNYNRQSSGADDPSIPRSRPLHPNDIYIPKRMIIAGSYYCEEDALAPLRVGCRLTLVLEPQNNYDPGAVRLEYNGKKIGYIAKADREHFTRCLACGGIGIYGVITAITRRDGRIQYEFETWFENRKEMQR